jgi:hypothetical protein
LHPYRPKAFLANVIEIDIWHFSRINWRTNFDLEGCDEARLRKWQKTRQAGRLYSRQCLNKREEFLKICALSVPFTSVFDARNAGNMPASSPTAVFSSYEL